MRPPRALASLGALLGVSIVAAGCLAPRVDPSTFYVLTSAAPVGNARVPVRLGVGPVTLPGYLDRSQIVRRLGEHQVALSDGERWAEPLRENLARTLTENLTRTLQPDAAVAYPWHPSARVGYAVAVDFTRFEPDTTGLVRLEAAWQVTEGTSGAVVQRGTSRIDETADGAGTEPAIAAMSRALVRLSDELAGAVRRAHGASGGR